MISGLFLGLAPAVIAIVSQALIRVCHRALIHPAQVALAGTAFVALTLFAVRSRSSCWTPGWSAG